MTIYRGIDINSATTSRPWGEREEDLFRAMIDTILVDSMMQTSATAGHKHNKIYSTSSIQTPSLNITTINNVVINEKLSVGSQSDPSTFFVYKDISNDPRSGFNISVGSRSPATGGWIESSAAQFIIQGKGRLSSSGVFEILPRSSNDLNMGYNGVISIHACRYNQMYGGGFTSYGLVSLYTNTCGLGALQYMEALSGSGNGTTSNFKLEQYVPNTLNLSVYHYPTNQGSSSIILTNNYPTSMNIYYRFEGVII